MAMQRMQSMQEYLILWEMDEEIARLQMVDEREIKITPSPEGSSIYYYTCEQARDLANGLLELVREIELSRKKHNLKVKANQKALGIVVRDEPIQNTSEASPEVVDQK